MPWSIYYTIQNQEAVILRCQGDDTPLAVPEAIAGYPVTALGPDCFGAGPAAAGAEGGLFPVSEFPLPPVSRAEGTLARVSLPDGIHTIGDRAFARCRALKRLSLPKTLRHLGVRVFDQCGGLEHAELPEGVTDLPDYTFSQCRKLARVTLPQTLRAVGNHAFYHCAALESLELPQTVDFVGGGVFLNCKKLARLTVPIGVNLSVLVADLTNDLDLTVCYPDGVARFFLPGFSYEYEDINAPRMWRTITYGSGQLYRECFSSRDIDFALYERYFDLARKQDSVQTTVRIAWYRLRWPYHLGHGREVYLEHIAAHCKELMAFLLARDDLEGLEALLELVALEKDQRDALLRQAERAGKVRFVSRLLEASAGSARGAEKEFDL